jgi:S1-C subfamily serine protease
VGVIGLAGANVSHANPKIYEKTLTSSAWVVTASPKKELGWGTGVVIDVQKKWLLTNYHVMTDTADFVVLFPVMQNGHLVVEPKYYLDNLKKLSITGKVILRDKVRDLALIELKSLPAGIKALPLATQSPKPGETLHTIGNSGANDGGLWRYTRGEVRQVYSTNYQSTVSGSSSMDVKATVVETQMPLNPGDSGGPVVDDRGLLVGINQSSGNKLNLVSRAIDVSEIRTFLRSAGNATAKLEVPEPTAVRAHSSHGK